jgi:hypothetical protein
MSLARTALREGRAEGAIRTHARRGYRFCADVEESDEVRRDPAGAAEALAAGQWETAEAVFRSVDAVAGLSADGLEQWAQVLQYTGRGNLAIAPLERAVAAHAMAGARGNAARSALCLAHIEFEQRNFAVAEGWLQRASRSSMVKTIPARQVLAWLASRMALATGDNATALDRAEQAA